MFRIVIAQGRSLIQQSDEIERLAHARLAEHGEYQLLRKIPGISPDHAPARDRRVATPRRHWRVTSSRC